jgi:hypothetical protein
VKRLALSLVVVAALCGGRSVFAQVPPHCGDGYCDPSIRELEDPITCPRDCRSLCGNGVCFEPLGENSVTCPQDCSCGNGRCEISEFASGLCPRDCFCGDGICIEEGLETAANCPQDCFCGNRTCEAPEYDGGTCPEDCDFYCGNGLCELPGEDVTCPEDCD